MNTRAFLNEVIDYIEVTNDVISGLRKQAAAKVVEPAFSEETLQKTAATLVEAELVSKGKEAQLIESFKKDPNTVLQSLQKVAALRIERANNVTGMVGTPVSVSKESEQRTPAAGNRRESDIAFEKHFKLKQGV